MSYMGTSCRLYFKLLNSSDALSNSANNCDGCKHMFHCIFRALNVFPTTKFASWRMAFNSSSNFFFNEWRTSDFGTSASSGNLARKSQPLSFLTIAGLRTQSYNEPLWLYSLSHVIVTMRRRALLIISITDQLLWVIFSSSVDVGDFILNQLWIHNLGCDVNDKRHPGRDTNLVVRTFTFMHRWFWRFKESPTLISYSYVT